MDRDDAQTGYLLSRREALALLGAAGLTAIGGRFAGLDARQVRVPACIVRPEQTEGPYFVDEKLNRSDIRTDPSSGAARDGVPLDLGFQVSQVVSGECRPLSGALVDVWQCDALGVYSDVRDMSGRFDTVGQKFLRGYQLTDAQGTARFMTIFPGWYEGRTVHIHFKIRTPSGAGRTYDFTSQLYFDDALTDHVLQQPPYASKGPRRIRNAQDGIYRRGGDQLMLALAEKERGLTGMFDIGLQFD
jgi:protocatechuate 3,4-dioxygenase beta subunit